jgi:cytochrome c-type biogenesis protein
MENSNSPQKIKFSERVIFIAIALVVIIGAVALLFRTGAAKQLTGVSMLVLIPATFLSGVLSFLSPCTLPILPAYFAYTFQSRRQDVIYTTLAFFAGLAATMTVLGASATIIGRLLLQSIPLLTFLGGIVIIIFGIMTFLGLGFSGFQFKEHPSTTIAGSFVYGAIFSLGWTACIGPILGAVLTLLATQGIGLVQGAILSFVYALGISTPLIILATFFRQLGSGSRFWRFLRGKGFEWNLGAYKLSLHTTEMISGILLIAIGGLLLTGKLTLITQLASRSSLSLWVVNMDEKIRLFFGLR